MSETSSGNEFVNALKSAIGPKEREFSDEELGAAWRRVMAERHNERSALQRELASLASEIYVSDAERSEKIANLYRKVQREENDLIALGMVLETARRQPVA